MPACTFDMFLKQERERNKNGSNYFIFFLKSFYNHGENRNAHLFYKKNLVIIFENTFPLPSIYT